MKKLKLIIQRSGLNITEGVILVYIILTAIYILSGASKLDDVAEHILARLVIISFIFFMARLSKKINKSGIFILLRNIYPFLFLGYFYKETGYMNNILFDYFDFRFVKLEEFLWGMQPSMEFSARFPQRWLGELMNFGYFFYYLLTFGTVLSVFYFSRSKTEKAVFVIVTSFLIYYIVFALFPVEGPQFYFSPDKIKTADTYMFGYLVKKVQEMGEAQTGAFPSSHVGMSIVFLILNYKYARKIFWFILIPVVLLWFATVYIKAHYLIDTLMGFPSGILVYWLSVRLYGKISHQN